MDIKNISNVNKIDRPYNGEIQKKNMKKEEETKNNSAVIFEKSQSEDKTHVYDKSMIDKLKMDSENTRARLKKMVEKLLIDQNNTLKILNPKDNVKIDEATRAKAKNMIDPEGELGIESVSDKIVDFAKALSGGDKGKLETLKGAIEKGFLEAERILGGTLPDISQKTYDAVMEKLDTWENE